MDATSFEYPAILELCAEHLDSRRSESAAFLIWYMENYYRLDPLEAVDSVCDNPGDKGVDGILVNDNDNTVTIFQAKLSQAADRTVGDAALRALMGTLAQFQSPETIQNLIATGGNAEVTALAKRLDLTSKIASHELRGIFLSNVDMDANGAAFLAMTPVIQFVGRSDLIRTYISDEREPAPSSAASFDIDGFHVAEYTVDATTKAVIAPVKATELIELQGIPDQSVYAHNVRGPLGKTKVNKDIVKSIQDKKTHKLFPLFHNGITVIADKVVADARQLTVTGYHVVNGCQSLTALYGNQSSLTDNLRVLTKFIQMEPNSPLAKQVTEFSNNQNGVKARDFMSNNPIQIRLQNEFLSHYRGQYALEIKRGEPGGRGIAVSNEEAGLLLMAFDLKEPWATHRKYQVFEDKYVDLFGRREVTADRIVLLRVIADAATEAMSKLNNRLMARYQLTRYLVVYAVRLILESDPKSHEVFTRPEAYVRLPADREDFARCIRQVVGDIVIDLNAEVDDVGGDFDYRDKLRDSDWVRGLASRITTEHMKLVERKRITSFSTEWAQRRARRADEEQLA